MDINRLKKLSGLTESVDLEEQVGNEGLLRAALMLTGLQRRRYIKL